MYVKMLEIDDVAWTFKLICMPGTGHARSRFAVVQAVMTEVTEEREDRGREISFFSSPPLFEISRGECAFEDDT